MQNETLILRPDRLVSAYAIAPLFGVMAWWLISCLSAGSFLSLRSLLLLPWGLMFGYPIILIAELLFVSPVIWAHRTFRLRWLNGVSACVIAAVVGVVLGFCFGLIPTAPGIQPKLNDMLGWAAVTAPSAVGVAIAFRLIAYQSAHVLKDASS